MRPLFFYCILVNMSDKTLRDTYKAEYRAWRNMRQRCNNKNVPNYYRYGGRGITVCQQWDTFETFLEDMGLRPSAKHSIDRRDNNGNYEPSNCYWATREQQENNKESTILLTHNGRTLSLAQWAKELGMSYDHIRSRYRYGWDIASIIKTPKNKHHRERINNHKSRLITHNGKTMNIAQWAKELGTTYDVLRARSRYGWSDERIITTPVKKAKLYPNR